MWMNWSFRKQQGTYSEVLLKEKMDMKETERAILEAKKAGFDQAVPLVCSTVEPLQEIRQMCASNTCQKYGKNWSCPPACGSLKECREEILERSEGILVSDLCTRNQLKYYYGENTIAYTSCFLWKRRKTV